MSAVKMTTKKEWDTYSIKNYKTVEKIKKQLRKGNWSYLCRHPEIRAVLRVFIHEAINNNPSNIYEFAAQLFDCNNSAVIIAKINKQLKFVNAQLKKSRWSEFDGDAFVADTQSTHSLLSTSSIPENINSILRYTLVLHKSELISN